MKSFKTHCYRQNLMKNTKIFLTTKDTMNLKLNFKLALSKLYLNIH